MPDQILDTQNKPRRNIAREPLTSPNCVRVWRNSPEDVMLQLRRTNDYICISLSFDEARQLAAMLIENCGELPKKHPANMETEMLYGKTSTMGIIHRVRD